MDEYEIVAILRLSAGNAETGEAWDETAVFSSDTPLSRVVTWAMNRAANASADKIINWTPLKHQLRLQLAQRPAGR